MDKKGKNYCMECTNDDDTRMEVLDEAPWVAECMECGHPNDNVRYDHRADRHPRGDV
jgi:uncharacterized Zn finger protein